MTSYIVAVGLGVGLGYTITQAERTEQDDNIRTQYIGTMGGYEMGWRFDRHKVNHDYKLSLRFKPSQNPPRRAGWRFPPW